MSSLSLCMIVKNEEQCLERCLNSIKNIFDEIIIVDTGSSDLTKDIAKKYTLLVYDFKWCDDFSKARNYAFSLATSEYVMWLDADDVVPKKSQKALLNLKQNLSADVYMLKYDIAFLDNKPSFSYYRERILKNCKNAIWKGAVHECITPFGKVKHLDISIEHRKLKTSFSDRNLKIYENILKTRQLCPREQYYYGRELFDHKKYLESIEVLEAFINSGIGWSENVIDALYLLHLCYKNLKDDKKSLNCLFHTFLYDQPRANICCAIGDYFFVNKNYKQAIFWFLQATACKDVAKKGGFVESKYYNYYPYLQLCCCFYYLNDIEKAVYYNEQAGKCTKSEAVNKNREFFNSLKNH